MGMGGMGGPMNMGFGAMGGGIGGVMGGMGGPMNMGGKGMF